MVSFQSPSVILIKVSCQGKFYCNGKSRTMRTVCGISAFSLVKGFHIYYSMPWFVAELVFCPPPDTTVFKQTIEDHFFLIAVKYSFKHFKAAFLYSFKFVCWEWQFCALSAGAFRVQRKAFSTLS